MTSQPPFSPPPALDYARPHKPLWPAMLRVVLGLIAATVLLIIAWRISSDPAAPVSATTQPAIAAASAPAALPATRPTAASIYPTEIAPLIDAFEQRNSRAAERAIVALRERIEVRRQGVAPFARDVTSWGTRFGVIKRKAGDGYQKWWNRRPNVDTVNAYVSEKFRRHILSEQLLQADVTAVLWQLEDELAASRNLLYADLRLPLAGIDSPIAATDPAYAQFQEKIRRDVESMATKMGTDSVTQGIAAFAGGWIVGDVAQFAARQVVSQIIARAGTQMAVQGVAAGGATAGGATTGGGVGSFGGPAGTVIGVGIGIAAGAAVDWWMSKRFEEKLIDKCNLYLDALRDQLIAGNGAEPGLEYSMRAAVQIAQRAQRAAIHSALHAEGT